MSSPRLMGAEPCSGFISSDPLGIGPSELSQIRSVEDLLPRLNSICIVEQFLI
jgi:hypothetical protein